MNTHKFSSKQLPTTEKGNLKNIFKGDFENIKSDHCS